MRRKILLVTLCMLVLTCLTGCKSPSEMISDGADYLQEAASGVDPASDVRRCSFPEQLGNDATVGEMVDLVLYNTEWISDKIDDNNYYVQVQGTIEQDIPDYRKYGNEICVLAFYVKYIGSAVSVEEDPSGSYWPSSSSFTPMYHVNAMYKISAGITPTNLIWDDNKDTTNPKLPIYKYNTSNTNDSNLNASSAETYYDEPENSNDYEDNKNNTSYEQSGVNNTPNISPTAVKLSGRPNFEGNPSVQKIKVIEANASSTIDQSNIKVSNDAMFIFDGNDVTSWQEGVSGYGGGQWVDFTLGSNYEVKYVGFKLGNWRSDKWYTQNGKPKSLTLTVGESLFDLSFTNEKTEQWIQIDGTQPTQSMSIILKEAYPGTVYEDTCIAEIELYGVRNG